MKTPRGYGVIVNADLADELNRVLVELDGDGIRVLFTADQLQVAES